MTERTITKICMDRFWLIKYDKNQWIYTEFLTNLLRKLENDIIEKIAHKLGFKEWIFLNIINKKTLNVYGLKNIKPFYIKNNLVLDPLKISLYQALANKYLKKSVKVFERNTTFRNEKISENFHTANEFRRLDFYYIGKPKEVLDLRNNFIKLFKVYLKKLDIECKIINKDEKGFIKEFYCDNLELGNIGTKKDTILKKFRIRNNDLWAGYASIGLDRILYCILKKNLR